MSKWINKDLFNSFQKEKIEEKETPTGNFMRSELLWQNPERGTVDNAKVYEGRFVPDPNGEFYKKYLYHFWKSGETWKFVLCPKTYDFKNYCPLCSAVSKLYNGTKQDKAQGYELKRKERFVGNYYVAKDSRDDDRDEDKKVVGKIKLYEFPSQIEKKLKNEVTDKEQGYGYQVFDPSSNGRNIIIKVLSTKPDSNKKQWPDYSSTAFSRTQSALGTDEEIDALMATCTDLVKYIESMKKTNSEVVEILKSEFIWELVVDEAGKYGYVDSDQSGDSETATEERVDRVEETAEEETTKNTEDVEREEEVQASDDELDDDDLLAQLDDL